MSTGLADIHSEASHPRRNHSKGQQDDGEHTTTAPCPIPPTAKLSKGRLAREWKTVSAMVHLYCCDHHGEALCGDCAELLRYVNLRLDRCRFGPDKPTCANCPVHCYQRDRREQIWAVMRYAGPRMLWKHPWLSLRHLLDGWFKRVLTTLHP